jgi:antitoxin component YwqK of YwqJK toxin-antitoxin module
MRIIAFLLTMFSVYANAQVLNVYENDNQYKPEAIKYTQTDSAEGKIRAEYMDYPGKEAFSANYYNKFRTGFVRYYYPDGKLMKTQVFQKSKKNGEYTLYDQQGVIVEKGFYVDNVKDGYWNWRKYQFMGKYKDGLKSGRWVYIVKGVKQIYHYKKGVLEKSKTPLPDLPAYILNDGVVPAKP